MQSLHYESRRNRQERDGLRRQSQQQKRLMRAGIPDGANYVAITGNSMTMSEVTYDAGNTENHLEVDILQRSALSLARLDAHDVGSALHTFLGESLLPAAVDESHRQMLALLAKAERDAARARKGTEKDEPDPAARPLHLLLASSVLYETSGYLGAIDESLTPVPDQAVKLHELRFSAQRFARKFPHLIDAERIEVSVLSPLEIVFLRYVALNHNFYALGGVTRDMRIVELQSVAPVAAARSGAGAAASGDGGVALSEEEMKVQQEVEQQRFTRTQKHPMALMDLTSDALSVAFEDAECVGARDGTLSDTAASEACTYIVVNGREIGVRVRVVRALGARALRADPGVGAACPHVLPLIMRDARPKKPPVRDMGTYDRCLSAARKYISSVDEETQKMAQVPLAKRRAGGIVLGNDFIDALSGTELVKTAFKSLSQDAGYAAKASKTCQDIWEEERQSAGVSIVETDAAAAEIAELGPERVSKLVQRGNTCFIKAHVAALLDAKHVGGGSSGGGAFMVATDVSLVAGHAYVHYDGDIRLQRFDNYTQWMTACWTGLGLLVAILLIAASAALAHSKIRVPRGGSARRHHAHHAHHHFPAPGRSRHQ